MKIKPDTMMTCAYCFEESTAKQWNDTSFAQCTNREMKRSFTQLDDTKALLPKSNTYYMCPKCRNWNKSNLLKF